MNMFKVLKKFGENHKKRRAGIYFRVEAELILILFTDHLNVHRLHNVVSHDLSLNSNNFCLNTSNLCLSKNW